MNKKIIYIVNARIPTEKAHGFQIVKMCEEFALGGADVELWFPQRENKIKENLFSFYGVGEVFKIKEKKSLDLIRYIKYLGKASFYLQKIFFLLVLVFEKADKRSLIYTRDAEIAWLFRQRGFKVFFEAHNWPQSKTSLYKLLLQKINLIICNSYGTEESLHKNGFLNTLVCPNGVDLEKFNEIKEDKKILKEDLSLPLDKKIVMYVGHLYKWKGVDIVLESAKSLIDNKNIIFVFVGGTKNDLDKYQSFNLSNVVFYGHQKKELMPKFMKSADILLLPNIAITPESEKYTSPIKMFEYMASGSPIIASDLPSIREVLNESNSVLVEAGNSNLLTKEILNLLNDPERIINLSGKALEDARLFSWKSRSEKIVSKFKNFQSVCYFGDYESQYSRNRVLIRGFKENNINIVECNSSNSGFKKYLDLYRLHKKLKNNYDFILVGYSNNRWMVLWAKILSRKFLVWDVFYSLHDSYVFDRRLVNKNSIKAAYYWLGDYFGCLLADKILLDTNEQIDYFVKNFQIKKNKFIRVLVGADNQGGVGELKNNNKFTVFFYGKYIPLQGVEYIIKSAKLLEEYSDIEFNLIGSGQTYAKVKNLAEKIKVINVNFSPKMSYGELIDAQNKAGVCLGIFGETGKASRVIPNKIYDAISLGKPVITADTPAIHELFEDRKNILLCEKCNEKDLANKILEIKENDKLREEIAKNGYILFNKVAAPGIIVNNLLQDLNK